MGDRDNRPQKRRERLSGAEYRKRKKLRQSEAAKQKGALDAFFVPLPCTSHECEDAEGDTAEDDESQVEEVADSEDMGREEIGEDGPTQESYVGGDLGYDFGSLFESQGHRWSSEAREHVLQNLEEFQHKDGPFEYPDGESQRERVGARRRKMTQSWFFQVLPLSNKQEIKRDWLAYSPSKRSAFCMACILFPSTSSISVGALAQKEGFKEFDYRKKHPMALHEGTKQHRTSFIDMREAQLRLRHGGAHCVDSALRQQLQREKEKARHIVSGLIRCARFLAQQNLAFQGTNLSSSEDGGNFVELVKLVSTFDATIARHVERCRNPVNVDGNTSKRGATGHATYLSNVAQNEMIELLGEEVRSTLVADIVKHKYFGIMIDSTPDVSRIDQHSIIIRHVSDEGDIKESFLGFFEVPGKDAASIASAVPQVLAQQGLDFMLCRAQCYDNAATMAGWRSGVRTRLSEVNPTALFVNCDNHSLNLACVHSAEVDARFATFFAKIEALHSFFHRSTARWNLLKEAVKRLLKSCPETRWSGRTDAVRVIEKEFNSLCALLHTLSIKPEESPDTRREAQALLNGVLTYEFACNLKFWSCVLGQVDLAQKLLQMPDQTLKDARDVFVSLRAALVGLRAELPSTAAKAASEFCEEQGVAIERCSRRKKKMPGEESEDASLSIQEEISRVQKEAIDRLCSEVEERTEALESIYAKFGRIMDVPALLNMTKEERVTTCSDFAAFYSADIDAKALCDETEDFAYFVNHMERPPTTVKEVLRLCHRAKICPQLHCAMKLMMTIGTSIASCERSFSKLKLLKNFLRARTGQERLNDLAIISIEKEVVELTNPQALAAKFVDRKHRRVRV